MTMGAKLAKSVRVCFASIYTHIFQEVAIIHRELFVYFFDIFWANERTALVGPPLRYLLLRQTHRLTASKRSSAGSFTPALNRSVQRL